MEQLIEEVRSHAALWDTRLPQYRDAIVKEKAWDEITTVLGKQKKEVKSEWRRLKDSHRQALNRRKTKSGDGATNRKEWKYEKQMEFLLPTMTHGETYTNIPSPSQGETEVQMDEEDGEDVDESSIGTDSQQTDQTYREKRRRDLKGAEKVIQFMAEKEKRKLQPKTPDELDLFFASITQTVRKLPRHVQLQLKREILNCVTLAEEQHEWATTMTGNIPNTYEQSNAIYSPSTASSSSNSSAQRSFTQQTQAHQGQPSVYHNLSPSSDSPTQYPSGPSWAQ